MQAKTIRDATASSSSPQDLVVVEEGRLPYLPAGSVLEGAAAIAAVLCGLAEPADKECEDYVNLSAHERQILQQKQAFREQGVQEEDMDQFLSGHFAGYDDDGRPIPGPNYISDIIATDV